MLRHLAILSLLVTTVAPAAMAAGLPCASANSDPCVLSSSVTIPVGLYDIRPHSLVVGNKQITVSNPTPGVAGEFKILANNITLQPGARFVVDGTDGNTTITLDAGGTMDIQSQGTSKSKIDVSGNFGGGTINLHSVGNLTINGTLISNATNTLGYGGSINVKTDTGDVTITGDPSEGIRSFGNAQGGGGTIDIEATAGSIAVSTQLVAKGGDCGSCEVDLFAGQNVSTTPQGVVDLGASGAGDGGFFYISAGGDLNLAGNFFANGSSADFDGGAGGDLLIDVTGSVTMSGRVEVNGAGQDAAIGSPTGSVDGDGGTSDITAGTFINVTGPMFGVNKGFGQTSDEFSFDAGTDVTLAGAIDVSGDEFASDITVLADGLVTVTAPIKTTAPTDIVNHPSAFGATIDIESCQISLPAAGQLVSTGAGGAGSGDVLLVASTGMNIAGTITSTSGNEFDYRTSFPVVTGTVTPLPTLVQDDNLPCCGVQCPPPPTTTTTTSSTTSTSTSSSTSSSTSTVVPSSSSTIVPTTSSSSTVVPTTSSSSTIAPATTSSSTVAPTTSSSSTVAPTTSSSSTVAPTTSSSSTIAPSSTTTSSTGPVTSTSSTTTTLASSTSTSTLASTTTSTSTLASTTSTHVTTTSTLPTTTSSTSVPTTTSTSTIPATPTTTIPQTTCLDTASGLDAVACRLEAMQSLMAGASEDQLGGHKLSRQLNARITKAIGFVGDPSNTKHLKKAARLLKGFSNQLAHGLAKRKTPVDPTLGAELGALLNDALSELTAVVTG